MVGSGSIAQRHVRNLLEMRVRKVTVVTARDVSTDVTFTDPRVSVSRMIPNDPPRVAIIANDSDRHVETARRLAAHGVHLLVEKPIAVELTDDLAGLCSEMRAGGLIGRVAYNLRFLGVMAEIRRVIDGGELGTMVFARIEVGQWLPDWRPNRPHDASYSASAGRGGGVALDLSHEVDYMRMLFGQPTVWCGRTSRTGVLGIEAPDVFDAIYSYPQGFSCTVHMDYLERTVRRRIRIVGTEGVVDCDIAARRMEVTTRSGTRVYDDPELFDVASTYVQEIVSFFGEVADPSEPSILPSFDDACAVLALVATD